MHIVDVFLSFLIAPANNGPAAISHITDFENPLHASIPHSKECVEIGHSKEQRLIIGYIGCPCSFPCFYFSVFVPDLKEELGSFCSRTQTRLAGVSHISATPALS